MKYDTNYIRFGFNYVCKNFVLSDIQRKVGIIQRVTVYEFALIDYLKL